MVDDALQQWGRQMADIFESDAVEARSHELPVSVRLAQTRVRQRALEAETRRLVERARGEGLSWDRIGRALEMTSEGARKKFGP